ncbi:MAG: putative oxygen-independent coproporphyrinogen III oxidase [Candidatus Midichloriaceae bacterium]|jgi:putative oxygen-independent coproporphyrinogen III oxidase
MIQSNLNSFDISVYIHWPFCKTKCPYCDFNSHENDSINHLAWLEGYLKEIELNSDYLKNKNIVSIFFGGGTPSLMDSKVVLKILNKLASYSSFLKDIEITLEANPNSVDRKKFKEFYSAGINRISIGIQSLNDDNLKFLGRSHSSKDAFKAIDIAQSVFSNYSFDLMYALPGQTIENWQKELNSAIQYIGNHISCYQLTIEKGTKFFNDYRDKKFDLLDDGISANMYSITSEILASNSIYQYEISNYSKIGFECKHNIRYWKLNSYLGFGPGAHGRFQHDGKIYSTINFYDPKKWLDQLKNSQSVVQKKSIINEKDDYVEKIIMGMRLNSGMDLLNIDNKEVIEKLLQDGYIQNKDNKIITTTKKGKLFLNYVIRELTKNIC